MLHAGVQNLDDDENTVSCCSTMVGIQQQTDRDNKERCERIE